MLRLHYFKFVVLLVAGYYLRALCLLPTVSTKCCCSSGHKNQEVRPHNDDTARWPPLASVNREWVSKSLSSPSGACMVLHWTLSQRCSVVHASDRWSRPSSFPFGSSWRHYCLMNKYQDVRPKKFCCVRTSPPTTRKPVAVRAGASLLGRRLPSRVRQHLALSSVGWHFDLRGAANTQQLWRQNFCSRGTSPVELSSSPAV